VIYPIETGLPDNTVECSPSFYREGDKIYLSFVAATPSIKGLRYKLYLSSGPNFKKLHPAEQLSYRPLFFGFVSPSHTCWGTKSDLNVKEKASGNVFRIKTTFARIFRVTFLSELPSKLLITGRDDKFCDRTVLYDLTTEQSFDITADGDVYKSTIYGELLIFAKKNGEDFENRKLLVGDYLLERSSIKVLKESANA
jgi:hypothetical protein